MKTLTNLLKAAVAVVVLPVDVLRDAGPVFWGDDPEHTQKRVRQIERAINKAVEP